MNGPMPAGIGEDGTRAPAPVSRREALKRGAVVGGSLIWAVPIVQTLVVAPATAQGVSPGPGPGGPGPGPGGPGPGPGDTTTTTQATTTTSGQPTTTTTQQGTTTTTQQGTTTTTQQGGTTSTTTGNNVPTEVLAVELEAAPVQQVLTTPTAAPQVLGTGLRRTGSEVGDLAILGGATTALGAAAMAWSRWWGRAEPADGETESSGSDNTPPE